MPYSFETGEHAPNIPNQPKLPMKHFAALIASILISLGYHNSQEIQEGINDAIGHTIEMLPKNLDEAITGALSISKS